MTNYIARVAQRILLLRYPWGTSHHTYWHTARTHDTDNTPLPHALCLSQNRAQTALAYLGTTCFLSLTVGRTELQL